MVVLVNLVVDRNSSHHTNIEPNSNWHHRMVLEFEVEVDLRQYSPDYLTDHPMRFELDHRNFLAVDLLAK